MGFDEGSIILNSENETYYAGQTIYGKFVFKQDKVKTFRGLFVKVKGFCKVHWTTTHTRRENDRSYTYEENHESYEEYFSRKVFLLGGENGEYHLQPGKHELPFDCPIPANCPSSFEGSYGHVRYEIKIVVDRAFKIDQEKIICIRVIAPLDLNVEPYCKEPMQFDIEDTYCCCCVSYGSSETVVKLPVSGYCPGQVIPIEVNCSNQGGVEINQIKLSIKKRVTYQATQNPDTKHESDTIAEIKKGPIPGGTTRSWMVDMEVPTMDVYNMGPCRFIDMDYDFKVTVKPEGCHSDSDDTRRIVIGTVPLVGHQDNLKNPLQDQMPIVNQPVSTVSPYPSNPYPDGNSPYPGPISTYPGQNAPYPGVTPYPGANPPYPSAVSPYPDTTSPYATNPLINNPPYPGVNIPSPNPPYPTASPYPANQTNPPYPVVNSTQSQFTSPYKMGNPPYPCTPNQPNVPYPSGSSPNYASTGSSSLRTGTFGFTMQGDGKTATIPTLSPGINMPYPTSPSNNPYATASAPEPATPDSEYKANIGEAAKDSSSTPCPPFNAEYVDKKDVK